MASAPSTSKREGGHREEDGMLLGAFDGYLPLSHDTFSSSTKCGGRAVLHPKLAGDAAAHAQLSEWRRCRNCGSTMYQLLQAFAPLPQAEVATSLPGAAPQPQAPHNRMLYVFACNSAACASKPALSWSCVSVQLDADDEDALNANDDEDCEDEPIPVGPTPREFLEPFVLPPVAVAIVPEPRKEVIVPTDVEQELIKAAEANLRSAVTDDDIRDLEDKLDLKDKPVDCFFDKFRRRIARCPTQVLRYQRRGLPLFMNITKTLDVVVPPCEHCGGPRAMELQLIPTLLYYCNTKQYVPEGKSSGDDGTDFGTATVYTCASGCLAARPGLVMQQEFLFVEPVPTVHDDVSADGRPSLVNYFSQAVA